MALVPGTNFNAATCLTLAGLLADRWPVLLLDVPGQPGLSAAHRPHRNRAAWYGRWLREVLEQTVPDRAVVAGQSRIGR